MLVGHPRAAQSVGALLLSQMRLAGLVTPCARGTMLLVPQGLKLSSQGQSEVLALNLVWRVGTHAPEKQQP